MYHNILMATKEYKTTDELISILESKGMLFSQKSRAKRLLNENNYYCITGYKKLFYKPNKSEFKENVDFEDLYAVYVFDKKFKTTVLKHLLLIEQKIKTAISNQISLKYGIDEKKYLRRINYDLTSEHLDENLKKIKEQAKVFGNKNVSVRHYKDKHGFIPFWVLSKCLTMGVIRDLFYIMKPNDQNVIVDSLLEKEFERKPVKKAKIMIALFADMRNMCAHDEKLIGYVHERITIPVLPEHSVVECKKNSAGDIIQGRSDILALFISMKYFVNKTMFNDFIQNISSCINSCYKKISHCISKNEFLDYIGLPENYEDLKRI